LDRRKQFSLLVVRGDGARVLRFSFSRRFPLSVLGGLILLVTAFGVLAGDWWFMRTRTQDVLSLFRELDARRATIEGFNQRVAELQKEVASWRELHARIWEPFGPDAAPKGQGTGIGGPRATPPGQPPTQTAPSEELSRLAESVMEEGESLRALERLITRAGRALASLPSRWPVRGAVNSEFGNRKSPWAKGLEFHSGMDISAERGTPVRAPSAGTVAFAGTHSEYGLTVILDHGLDLRTIVVPLGQKVERGTDIGVTGNTGRSSGPHLHYEILVKGRSVNPRAYLWD
jgi:murein DD-endopeptidase MepM/ murein hydrolase activator NlpD